MTCHNYLANLHSPLWQNKQGAVEFLSSVKKNTKAKAEMKQAMVFSVLWGRNIINTIMPGQASPSDTGKNLGTLKLAPKQWWSDHV